MNIEQIKDKMLDIQQQMLVIEEKIMFVKYTKDYWVEKLNKLNKEWNSYFFMIKKQIDKWK